MPLFVILTWLKAVVQPLLSNNKVRPVSPLLCSMFSFSNESIFSRPHLVFCLKRNSFPHLVILITHQNKLHSDISATFQKFKCVVNFFLCKLSSPILWLEALTEKKEKNDKYQNVKGCICLHCWMEILKHEILLSDRNRKTIGNI